MFSIDVPPDPTSRAVNGVTLTGDRLKQVIGAPNSMCITPGPNQVLFVGESTYPGRIFKVALDGKVSGVIGRSGRNLGQFSGAHALACPRSMNSTQPKPRIGGYKSCCCIKRGIHQFGFPKGDRRSIREYSSRGGTRGMISRNIEPWRRHLPLSESAVTRSYMDYFRIALLSARAR
jgi:hypothetical protein